MTRRLAVAGVGTVAALLTALLTIGAGGGSGGYRVDAIFDNADFLIAGQDVKVAGAKAGSVVAVRLTPDRKARVEMSIDRRFAPFRADADCAIRPQSLIGEKFVQCDPGRPGSPLLAKQGETPTVPLGPHTHSPVDLDLLFTALRKPLRERLSIVVNELGAGLAGRPAELNAAIRRANPAIEQANRTLAILDSERRTLGRLIDGSDRVLAELAAHHGQVSDFIDRANAVADAMASRRGDLDLAIHRLPPLLAQLEPSANELAGLATEGRPVVRDLAASAPQLRALLGDFQPLADAARPTLVKLSQLSKTGLRAVRAALPVSKLLLPVAQRLPPTVAIAQPLVDSLIARGVPEEIARFLWVSTAVVDRFDQVSHIFPSYQLAGTCQQYAETPTSGCDAHFAGTGKGAPKAKAATRRSAAGRGRQRRSQAQPPGVPGQPRGAPGAPGAPPGLPLPRPPLPPLPSNPSTSQLLDFLLGP